MDAGNIDNLMGMAASAELAGNNVEAIAYYNRVLEADPTVSKAWLGKGRAAGWLSTLANIRLTETTVAFGHAIATSPDTEREAIAEQAADDAAAIVVALYKIAINHHVEFIALASSQPDFIKHCGVLSDALEEVRKWYPVHMATLATTASISRSVLNIGVSPEIDAIFRSRRDSANEAIRSVVPDYEAPELDEKTTTELRAEADRVATAKANDDASFQAAGYVVLFIVIIIAAIVRASS